MKTGLIITGAVATIAIVGAGMYMVDIDQTQEAALPEVEINVEAGQLPKFDAEVGSIQMTEEEVTMEVPNVEITMEEETVTVPGIEITPPKSDG